MLKRKKDKELELLSDEELQLIPLSKLQRIANKRGAHGLTELEQRARDELARRDPRTNWKWYALRLPAFHEKEVRTAGSFMSAWFSVETQRFHLLVCDNCGKSEFYNVFMAAHEKGLGFSAIDV